MSLVAAQGKWVQVGDSRGTVKQAAEEGVGFALDPGVTGAQGAWRCWVEPALDTKEAGLWFQCGREGKAGFLCTLGGNPEGPLGFAIRDAAGKTLWADEWAPWHPYEPYVLEGIVEQGRLRAQMFRWDAKTLISQSDWIAVPEEETGRPGCLGFHTLNGIARFWGAQRSETPLCPITADAPNKRRLVQGKDSEWTILGPGNWMWTDAKRTWVRQYNMVERTWAIDRAITGVRRTWACHVRVFPGAGGAGMMFQGTEDAKSGLLCWLGGTFGAGCLMLYRLPGEALWASPTDRWHYDTEYVMRAIVEETSVRVQLLGADGTTIAESPPVAVPAEETGRVGCLGFHTWKGMAEFSGFADATQGAPGEPGPPPPPVTQTLGEGWVAQGDGAWEWGNDQHTLVRQPGACEVANVVTTAVTGAHGTWHCRVKATPKAQAAGLLFQVDRELKEGFAFLLVGPSGKGGARLQDATGRVLWEDAKCAWEPDTEYVLEAQVLTDRIAVRLLAGDGRTMVAESPAVYVSARNNERQGHLGFTTRGGGAAFWGWSLK